VEIKEKIAHLVQEKLVSTENFLVEIKISPAKIIVTIDHPKGVKIEDCVAINRFLHEKLDESGVFNSHELEVGSPGMEEPLKILPQYKKRIGQQVSVLTFDGVKRKGTLLNADDFGIELNEENIVRTNKKKEVIHQLNKIPFTEIKETRVIFSFDKIIGSK
jgi:ribosome maturation factor RimP